MGIERAASGTLNLVSRDSAGACSARVETSRMVDRVGPARGAYIWQDAGEAPWRGRVRAAKLMWLSVRGRMTAGRNKGEWS